MKNFNKFPGIQRLLCAACILLAAINPVFSYTVEDLTATCHDGQVFITWKNPGATNLQYNVYRSSSKFTSTTQLTTSTLLGFVRDNSSKNIQFSTLSQNVYYKIENSGNPLPASTGLYVATCTANQSFYYAVTVTNLAGGGEAKTIVPGENSLNQSVNENLAKPQPVFQDSIILPGGEVKYQYVLFANNQETDLFPAMNSTGSYGFNFYLSKRGSATNYPLVAVYEGPGSVAAGSVGLDGDITNCYVVGVYDWLPIPGPGATVGVGDNTYFCCYHENFNIYTDENPIPVSGTVKTYTARRCIEIIRWVKDNFPIDATKVYTKGGSATGFGAMLAGMLYPGEIAATYATVEPMFVKPVGNKGTLYKEMWGNSSSELKSDVPDPLTQSLLPIYTVLDTRKMLNVNENFDLPLIFDVHGKKDQMVIWSPWIVDWFDTLQSNHVGGVFYWDQRSHSGTGKNFLSEETTPDFFRYQTNKSYPAFANCSINQNPGNGTPNNGDPYGAINGYLDWEDDITDEECSYTINVFIKDLYVSGVLDAQQFNTGTTDITFRRLQNFHPANGATIKWKNFDASNTKIQNGSISYSGGLITLKGITVNKSGNRIELKISNCQKIGEETTFGQAEFVKSSNGYTVSVDSKESQDLYFNLYDLTGRLVSYRKVMLAAGSNTFEITAPTGGIYLAALRTNSFSQSEKLFFQ